MSANKSVGFKVLPSEDNAAGVSKQEPIVRANRESRIVPLTRARRVSFVIYSESGDEGLTLETSASWSFYEDNFIFVNPLDTNFSFFSLLHRQITTDSLETKPSIRCLFFWQLLMFLPFTFFSCYSILQNQMILQDRKEREKGIAKNAVEAYVYEMRGKLYSQLEKFITEEVLLGSFLVWAERGE